MIFLGKYVGHALDMFENPPKLTKIKQSLDLDVYMIAGGVATIVMVSVIAMYFGYPLEVAPLAGIGVVMIELLLIGAGGTNVEFVLKTIRASGAIGRDKKRVPRR
jgi:hypothetical protein